MNIHHLELFYYVAKHGGISEAVRNIPYGIQQPAVSGQVIQLEESLGLTLFQRRPFELTPPGRELFEFIKPFFDNLDPMAEKLRGGRSQHIRIGASEIVLRDHLPGVLQRMRKLFPRLKVTLREGYYPEVISWLQRQEIDLFIGLFGGKPPAGITVLPLFQLPLALIVPKASKLKNADDLWRQDRIEEALITVPTNELICRAFQQGLARIKVDWFPSIEVSAVDLVQTYVANGYGIGVMVAVPKAKCHPDVRVLPVPGFEPVDFGVMYLGEPSPMVQAFSGAIKNAAAELMS